MRFLTLALILLACCSMVRADTIRLTSGVPLVGAYFFTHWWEPWKSSDEKVVQDMSTLKALGFNTVFLDSEWSQMIDGDWKWLDRGHKLAKQSGVEILPWLSLKNWLDIGDPVERRAKIKEMYGVDITMGVDASGQLNRTKPYDPAVIDAGTKYCEQYLERYLENGALLRVMRDGKPHPVIAIAVELGWEGSCDAVTQQMFRIWLRGKYADDIQKLNKKWKT